MLTDLAILLQIKLMCDFQSITSTSVNHINFKLIKQSHESITSHQSTIYINKSYHMTPSSGVIIMKTAPEQTVAQVYKKITKILVSKNSAVLSPLVL